MATPIDLVEQNQQGIAIIIEDLITRMTKALTQNQTPTSAVTYNVAATQIAIKFNETNYALWSQMLKCIC